ncbi:hypothetical protein AMAG_02037 [Allomyces macrogynus ATCC 38327]|uniref:SCP domain-containing protein n=1 Tax=Allomyces macrogynus (strain ATCC 38327) TaxID=578462 RepID=A0A0L0S0R1_ALLM3|nr:hypothetical protein AMAG_02037 [Allomyces macrogynus ATCC 38327]|eukprot:KNE56202.1 hypothetical protein AMAG_02037 [Allomyces macrogynus ATCC 38327]
MARATSFAALFIVILALLSSVHANATGGSSGKTPGTGSTPIAGSTDTYMFELLTLVNQHRSSLGLKPLCLTAGLINSAIVHSQDMANKQFMDHAGSDGSTPFTRMEKAGYVGFGYAAENIAYGSVGGSLKFETAAAVFKTWIESKGHRENIELPQVNQMGAGRAQGTCVGGRGTCEFWTQNFAGNDVNIYKCLTPGGGGGSTTTVTPNRPQPSQPPQQPSQPPQQPSQPPQQPTTTPTPQPPRTRTRITDTRQPVPTTVITTPRQPDQPGYPGQKPPVATSPSATVIVTATATATATAVPSPPSDESPRKSTPVADPPKYTTTADVPVAPPTATATAIATVTAPANPGYPSQPPAPTTPIASQPPTTPVAPQPSNPTTPVVPQPSNPTTPKPQPPTGGDSHTPSKPTPTRRPRRKCKCTCEGSDGKKRSYTTAY